MKKWICVLLLPVFLLGCGKQESQETVSDEIIEPVTMAPKQVMLEIPQSAAVGVMSIDEWETVYFCDGYTICMQTAQGGDLNRTLQAATGYAKDNLRLVETASGPHKRYDCTWSTTGEEEAQIGRTAVLDDGSYHYVMTCMTSESNARNLQEIWNDLFCSFTLNTGS